MNNANENSSFEESFELRSDEVQEIISDMPSWIIRWGISFIFLLILTILFITWLIKYPDILVADVIITTKPAPVNFVSRSNGDLVKIISEGEYAKSGDVIGYIKSPVSHKDILHLEESILTNQFYEYPRTSLGEIGSSYSAFITQLEALRTFENMQAYTVQIKQLLRQRAVYERLSQSLEEQYELSLQDLDLATSKFRMDSMLYAQSVTAKVDFLESKSTWLKQMRGKKTAEIGFLNNELQLNIISKQISDLNIMERGEHQKLKRSFENARNELIAAIADWKQNYLFIAPDAGRVAWLVTLQGDVYLEAGKAVASMVPKNVTVIAQAELPLWNSGKVKKDQQVNIKLQNYPFEEFGTISGRILYSSEVPSEKKYFVYIALPNGLKTNLSRCLPFKQQLSGTTEIITEDLRLFDRLIHHVRQLIN